MEISYKNSFQDFIQFNLYYLFHSKIALLIMALVLVPLGHLALDVARDVGFSTFGKVIVFSTVSIMGFGVFLVFVMILLLLAVFFSYRAHLAKWGICKIQIAESALVAESKVARSEVQWAGIEAIRRSKGLTLIWVTKRMAYLVPKRAFANETEANRFFAYANELWEKNKHTNANEKVSA